MGAQAVCLSCSKKPLPGSRARSIWRAQGIWPARAYARTPGRQLVLRTSARTHSATSPKCPGCVLVWLAAVGACTMESTPTGSSRREDIPTVSYTHLAYVDWHTLALLFCLMAVVAGFRSLGVLDAAGAWLVARARTQRVVVGVLVGLAFFASMAVTNDVALITFVPLALVVLRRAGMEGRMCLVATLMTIAANLGSMFTPVGNPQNLYLFTASGMGLSLIHI